MKLPLAQIERIMHNAGADHVAEGAVDELRNSVQEIAEEVAADAVKVIRDDGRNSVTRGDIEKAIEL